MCGFSYLVWAVCAVAAEGGVSYQLSGNSDAIKREKI